MSGIKKAARGARKDVSEFPLHDRDFAEHVLEKVRRSKGGWEITFDGCMGLYVPAEHGVEPKVGQTARFYPGGIGGTVRGLFFDGKRVWYRTAAEEKERQEIRMYGADAADLLRKWDAGETIHTIEMGGLGPGYEQCIQITAMEQLRYLLETKPDGSLWQDSDVWKATRDRISKAVTPKVDYLGLSGAQWGAALSLSTALYMRGPRQCLKEVPDDRHTMVSKGFPQSPVLMSPDQRSGEE